VFVLGLIFGPLEVVDIAARRVPPRHAPVIIQKGVVSNEKPAVRAVRSTPNSHFALEWCVARKPLSPGIGERFDVFGVVDPLTPAVALEVLQRQTAIRERESIGIEKPAFRTEDDDRLLSGVGHLS